MPWLGLRVTVLTYILRDFFVFFFVLCVVLSLFLRFIHSYGFLVIDLAIAMAM